MSEQKDYGHLFDANPHTNLDDLLRKKFANGQGVIQLQPNMSDDVLLTTIKYAVSISEGKPFLVIPTSA